MKKILVMNDERFVCLENEYEISFLTEKDMENTMEECLNKNSSFEKTSFPHSFIFYSGFSEEEIQQVSQKIKNEGIHAIQVGQTPVNLTWKLKDLLAEVKQEDELFHTKQQLGNLIKQTITLPFNEEKKDYISRHLIQAISAFSGTDIVAMQNEIQSLLHLLSEEMK